MGGDQVEILEARLAVTTEALRKLGEQTLAGQLALELMHEIRNPLDAIGNLAYLTLQEADNVDLVRERMALVLDQMAAIREIADHALGFAQASPDCSSYEGQSACQVRNSSSSNGDRSKKNTREEEFAHGCQCTPVTTAASFPQSQAVQALERWPAWGLGVGSRSTIRLDLFVVLKLTFCVDP